MFETIKTWQANRELRRFFRSEFGQAILSHTNRYFYDGSVPRLASLEEDTKERLIQEFYASFLSVYHANDPFLATRKQIAETVLVCTALQVLSLTEDDKAAMPDYAEEPYISGMLHHHIIELSDHEKNLKRYQFQNNNQLEHDELLAFCNTDCAILKYHLDGYNLLRVRTNDLAEKKDWLRPFFTSMMIWQEDKFRTEIDLPTLLPDDLDALRHSTFLDFVVSGERDPYFSWQDHYSKI